MTVFNSTDGDGKGFRSTTGKELAEAIQGALAHKIGPTLIERTIDSDDCTKQLIEWGSGLPQLTDDLPSALDCRALLPRLDHEFGKNKHCKGHENNARSS